MQTYIKPRYITHSRPALCDTKSFMNKQFLYNTIQLAHKTWAWCWSSCCFKRSSLTTQDVGVTTETPKDIKGHAAAARFHWAWARIIVFEHTHTPTHKRKLSPSGYKTVVSYDREPSWFSSPRAMISVRGDWIQFVKPNTSLPVVWVLLNPRVFCYQYIIPLLHNQKSKTKIPNFGNYSFFKTLRDCCVTDR